MSRKSLPPVGNIPFNPDNWHLPEVAKKKILTAVNIGQDEGAVLLEDVELAILMTRHRQSLHVNTSEIKKALQDSAKAAANMVKALNKIPSAGRQFYRHAGLPYHEALTRAEEIRSAAEQAVSQTKALFSGAGNEKNYNAGTLVADIRAALSKIGVEIRYSRPKSNAKGELPEPPAWQIIRMCFELCSIPFKADLYYDLIASRSAKVTWL